jgi:hypothetical protein
MAVLEDLLQEELQASWMEEGPDPSKHRLMEHSLQQVQAKMEEGPDLSADLPDSEELEAEC